MSNAAKLDGQRGRLLATLKEFMLDSPSVAYNGINEGLWDRAEALVAEVEGYDGPTAEELTAFAVGQEREACAYLCESGWSRESAFAVAEAIRKRGGP